MMDNEDCTYPAPSNNCLFTKCCQLPFLYTCYQKHESFAQCRKNGCPSDGSWMCTVVSDMPPSPPPSPPPCAALIGRTNRIEPPDWCNLNAERRANKELCENTYVALSDGKVMPCYHSEVGGSCMGGQDHFYCPPAMPSPPISPSPPNPPPAPPSQPPLECTEPRPANNCIESRCCKQPHRFTCYKKNEYYAQCRSNGCDENDPDWSCEVLNNPPSPPPLPRRPPSAPPQLPTGASLSPSNTQFLSSSSPPTASASLAASPQGPDTLSQQSHGPAVATTTPTAPSLPFIPVLQHQGSPDVVPYAFASPTAPLSLGPTQRFQQQPQGDVVAPFSAGDSSVSSVPVILSVVLVLLIAVVCSFRSAVGSAVKKQLLKRLGRTQLLGDDRTSAKDDEGGVEDPSKPGRTKGVSAKARSRHKRLSGDDVPADVPAGEEGENGVQLEGVRL